jgi:hypothetical protein
MFSSALKSFSSNISSNYTIAPQPSSTSGPWKIFDAKRKSTGKAASVFVFDKKSLEPQGGGLGGRRGASSLKRVHEEVVERLKREASSLARLRHPSILELAEPVEETRSGKIFEGCGTINVGYRAAHGAIEVLNTVGTRIPYLTLTGNPYFGLRFYGTKDLVLGKITMNLSAGIGIRFDRDKAANTNVKMDTITISGASSHAVETWNIDGLTINSVIARDVGECGLLLQNTRNARVKLVDGSNVGTDTGYATLRFANNNGQLANGKYDTNTYIDKVVSRGGGRGIFCVSQSGGAVISNVDLSNNGNNALLIENCYNLAIKGGKVSGGGEVRLAARSEFPNNKDISVTLKVDNNSVRESPCGENTTFSVTGNAKKNVC